MSGFASLNGLLVTKASVTLPRWGVWHADVWVDVSTPLIGSATLILGGLTLKGTIAPRGGAWEGSGAYRIVGGMAGWRKPVKPVGYKDPAGVLLSTVLGDAAAAVGESVSLGAGVDRSVGLAFIREAGPASRVLGLLVPEGWWVDEAGITRVGPRSGVPVVANYTVTDNRTELGMVEIACEAPEQIKPFNTIVVAGEALTILSVRHELDSDGIRSEAWVNGADDLDDFQRAVRGVLPGVDYFGVYEYVVAAQHEDDGSFDLRPSKDIGFPELTRVQHRPGVAGSKATLVVGSMVLVQFINGDPGRPFVSHFAGPGGGFLPTALEIDATGTLKLGQTASSIDATGVDQVVLGSPLAHGHVVRYGDPIAFGPPGAGTVELPAGGTISRMKA